MNASIRIILRSRYAALLTHVGLIGSSAAYFLLLVRAPYWVAFLPCVLLGHRIGILLHEYMHGIPFRRYATNHAVVTLWDGAMMMFGMLEVVRGTHLAHHRWVNVPASGTDDGRTHREHDSEGILAIDTVRYVATIVDALRGKKLYVRRERVIAGLALTLLVMACWQAAGHGDVVWKAIVVAAFTTAVPVSLRGAIEHNSHPGAPGFANEYGTYLPMFNVNRHIHHHEDPTVPWYLLEWRTTDPLPRSSYLTHWFRTHVTEELVPMQPVSEPHAARASDHDRG